MKLKKFLCILALLCAMVQGAWAQSSWDEVYAITQTNSANWTQLTEGSTTGKTLGTAGSTTYYYADTNLTFSNSTVSGSGLTIQGTVYLYVPEGMTLTCTGANASGQTGAGAGIELASGNFLNLLGSGSVNATGGNAANGGNGANGSDASCDWNSMGWAWVGGNGHGGNGGGGAGAGIGTRGANGGNGGIAPPPEDYYSTWTQNGVVGGAGSAGQTADAMGGLYVSNAISMNVNGGSQGSAGTAGTAGKSCMRYGGNEYSIPGGGGGGAGGFGGAANNIGPGGPGGGGGGGGAKGSHDWTSTGFYNIYANGGAGGQNADGSYAATGGTAGVSTANINNGTCETNDLSWVQEEERGKESSDVNTTTNGGAGGAAGSFVTSNIVTSTTTTLTSGLYYVISNVTLSERIQINGNVTLNLGEGATLTANKGIELSKGNSLTINGPGALTVDGCNENKSGIGAVNVGTLTINGGTIDVHGGAHAAGIGGDMNSENGGTITINGGVVTARGAYGGAGIGGGYSEGYFYYENFDKVGYGRCGTIVINGGQVTAIGSEGAAGIGPGSLPAMVMAYNDGGSVTIGLTNFTDFVYSSSYKNDDDCTLDIAFATSSNKKYMIEGTGQEATVGNIGGKTIVSYSTEPITLSGAGTQDNPWRISSTADWIALAQNVINNNSYSGEFVQLEADIIITRGVGVSDRSFSGTFLGNGHTITADLTTYNTSVAPFNNINGATIKNLTVAGTITTNQRHSSALAAYASGTNVIESCIVTATINTSTDYTGGFIGHGRESATTIRGCVFAGTVNGVDGSRPNVGIFWGWSNSGTPTLVDCLEKGTYTNLSSLHPMGLQSNKGTITNCYYVTPQIGSPSNACTVSGARLAYTFATAIANLGDLVQDYGLAKAYQNGIFYGGTYYAIPAPLAGSGTEYEPYIINNDYDWNSFAYHVNNGTSYSGQFVKLNSDISVSEMVGSSETNSFQGTFLGDGVHTLTFTAGSSSAAFGEENCAPFRYTKNATIRDLKVTGTIYTSRKFAAGLVARNSGTTTITNCQIGTVIHSSVSGDGTHGGIVAMPAGSTTTSITGCVYNGRLLTTSGTQYCGGFVGWSGDNTVTVAHSLYAPDANIVVAAGETAINHGATFVRGNTPTVETSCYYTETMGSAQGTRAIGTATAPANFGNLVQDYGMLQVYDNGILYDRTYYVAPANVSLADNADNSTTISGANGYFADVTLTDRTLYKDGKWNTICLPFDVTLAGSALNGATARPLTAASISGTTLNLTFGDAVNTLEAGTPYIIKWDGDGTSNIENPVFEGVTIEATKHDYDTKIESVTTDERVRFVGTYKSTAFGAEDQSILLMGAANTLYYPTTGAGIGAQRAYFKIGGEGALLASRLTSFSIDFGDGEETGIISVHDSGFMVNGSDVWYTLDGRRLNGRSAEGRLQGKKPTRAGVYINKGKKVVIK